jgi:anaerobic selenocysteine-containing dehydrogenase
MTRRSFAKMAAVSTAAFGFAGMGQALAENDDEQASSSEEGIKRVRSCCRGCGKMECGVWVTVQNGRAIRVEGDESAFQSMGNCCTKSQSSIQAAYHPDRLYYPMKRTTPRGEDDPGWVRITWDEAFNTIATKLREAIDRYGGESIFGMSGTSRIWGMLAYGALGQLTGSPNMAIPWQVCKGPRHMATALNSVFSCTWQENVVRPEVYIAWGTAPEMSNYDDSCRTIVDVREKANKFIIVDPRLTNLGKEADLWLNLRPGTDAAMALGWLNVIVENKLYDDLFVKRWTDSPFLVCDDVEPDGPIANRFATGTFQVKTKLLKESDITDGGSTSRFMVWDSLADRLTYYDVSTGMWEGENWVKPTKGFEARQKHLVPGVSQGFVIDPTPFDPLIDPALDGDFKVTLKDGRISSVRPVWEYFRERLAGYTPDKVAEITGVDAWKIEEAAKIYATRVDPTTGYGNGGIHYQLAIEHSCNGVACTRALDTIIGITGNWDIPGSSRGGTQAGYVFKAGPGSTSPGQPWVSAGQYEKVLGIEDFPILGWWQYWADDASLFKTLTTSDPYPLKIGWCCTGDFMNMSNSLYKWDAMMNLDFFIVEDLWKTPTAGMADLLLPAQHWIEVDCPRISQGAAGAQGATVRCVEPPAEAKHDYAIIVGAYQAMGVAWSANPDNPWPDLETSLSEEIAAFGLTWREYVDEFQKNGWWDAKVVAPETWGTYRRYETGMMPLKTVGNSDPFDRMSRPGFATPTLKMEIWNTTIETFMPEATTDFLPDYTEPPLSPVADAAMCEKYPYILTSGRRIPVYFHSEHRQLPWCRELWPVPRVEINPEDAVELGIKQGDWVWIENDNGKIRQCADVYAGIQKGVINCEHQWWFPELNQADKGFSLCGVNCLVTTGPEYQDRICGSSYLRAYPVKIYKATSENSPFRNPVPCGNDGAEIIHSSDDPRLKEWLPIYEGRE